MKACTRSHESWNKMSRRELGYGTLPTDEDVCDNSDVVSMSKQYLVQAIDKNGEITPIIEVPGQRTKDFCY
jgi:hypothetical protein